MKALTEILPDVFVVEVEADATQINIEDNFLFFKRDFAGLKSVGTMKPLPEGKYQYLGYCTKDEISFDVEPYIKMVGKLDGTKMYKNYNSKYDRLNATLNKNNSFRSLLLKHGLYWDNPLSKPADDYPRGDSAVWEHNTVLKMKSDLRNWQQYEQSKLTGKLVVLKKVTP